ncbi:uncharacterized protein FIBRA_07097 [Fibroporia radiculosa]|uniref:Metallo-beta-lactamase domain-containing protein n=1 Tax=Fibroporia radiculosa TaxID=599839 RepID=J4IBM1_9APHY|nr:uncharacterized protein FIBRA_07097 [Fibroporia radiculosa]CCM04901.1 predicted protein [Fibroporia radiculosa]
MILPPPSVDQSYCTVSALEAGYVDVPMAQIVDTAEHDEVSRFPCLAFLLRHSSNGDTFVFDLGIRKDWEEGLPPALVKATKRWYSVDVPQDVIESLQKGGYEPSQIKHVCISHIHFDHQGDPAAFVNATFIAGEDTRPLLIPGYPTDPNAHFPTDLLPHGRTRYVSTAEMSPIGPFPHALDFYGDGSLYIVDTPGHIPGHVTVLARTSSDGGWVYLAADAAHDWRLLTGGAQIADSEHYGCAHRDKETAAKSIEWITQVSQQPRVRVLLGHDVPWFKDNKDGSAFWPGSLESL